jgi:hypothetical protein
VGTRAAVDDVEVVGEGEQPEREGREDQLRREAEQVQRPRPLGGVHGAEGDPALGRGDDVVLERGGPLDIGDAGLAQLDGPPGAGAALVEHTGEVGQQGAGRRVGVVAQPVQALHEVAVGVVDGRPVGVGHTHKLRFLT